MKTSLFSFKLPSELIAQYPTKERGASRVMKVDRATQVFSHLSFKEFIEELPSDSLIIFNNTKVRPARLFTYAKDTNGKVEFLLLKNIPETNCWIAQVSHAKRQKVGREYLLDEGIEAKVVKEYDSGQKLIEFNTSLTEEWLNKYGHVPLPPYIKRNDSDLDTERYQPIYAKEIGSAAAPTAGLHFSNEDLELLKKKGIEIQFITLHVGLGTFLPVRTENIEEHIMHREDYEISEKVAKSINQAIKEKRPIIPVGTTVTRALESSWNGKGITAGKQSTELYITPDYEFKVVSQLFTNFHTPESSLLILVSSFAGIDLIQRAYQEAIKEKYRFFSYGDAMWIT